MERGSVTKITPNILANAFKESTTEQHMQQEAMANKGRRKEDKAASGVN